ncbi:MAG: M48 family metallopeptidase [Treponema sp.]|jgi:predicted metal-dependent hydrolase|nr:M48 family metallopeptidase [Treponema sp.]
MIHMPAAELLQVGNYRIEVEYRRIKTLRMTIYPPGTSAPGGRIRVSAPLHTPRQFIQNFVASKTAWIEKHRARFRGNPGNSGLPEDQELFYVWGLPHRLELVERQGRPRIETAEGRILMCVRPGDGLQARQKMLDRWYHRLLKEAASRMVPLWAARIGVSVQRTYYRKMKSHWGSCNYTKKTIRLNTELAKRRPQCLEYVILHELVHIIEPSHNRNFYRLMDTYLPDWKLIRKQMNRGEL